MRTRTVKGPFGPHAAKKEFYHKGKWHFLKWVAKHNIQSKERSQIENKGYILYTKIKGIPY